MTFGARFCVRWIINCNNLRFQRRYLIDKLAFLLVFHEYIVNNRLRIRPYRCQPLHCCYMYNSTDWHCYIMQVSHCIFLFMLMFWTMLSSFWRLKVTLPLSQWLCHIIPCKVTTALTTNRYRTNFKLGIYRNIVLWRKRQVWRNKNSVPDLVCYCINVKPYSTICRSSYLMYPFRIPQCIWNSIPLKSIHPYWFWILETKNKDQDVCIHIN